MGTHIVITKRKNRSDMMRDSLDDYLIATGATSNTPHMPLQPSETPLFGGLDADGVDLPDLSSNDDFDPNVYEPFFGSAAAVAHA